MFLKFPRKFNLRALISFSFFTILSFFGAALIFNFPAPAVYGQTANAWNLHRVGTDLNFYYGVGGTNALQLSSNGQMQARRINDLDSPATYYLDPDNTSNLKNIILPANGSRIAFPFTSSTSYTGFGSSIDGDMSDGVPYYFGIGREPGAFAAPHPNLVISNHVGVRLVAHGGYGGISIYEQLPVGGTWAQANAKGAEVARFRDQRFGGSYVLSNFGIGSTATPGVPFVVTAALGPNTGVTFQHTNLTQGLTLGYSGIAKTSNNGGNNLILDGYSTGNILLNASGGTGNVGIGTTAPKAKLDVGGFNDGDSLITYSPSNDVLALQTLLNGQPNNGYGGSVSNKLILQPVTGMVGIGTSPSFPLHVPWKSGDAAGYTAYIGSNAGGNNQTALLAETNSGNALRASSTSGYGVHASSTSAIGIYGESTNNIAVYGRSLGGSWAGHFYASGPSALYARADGNAAAWTTQIDRVSDAALAGGGLLLMQNYGVKDDASGYIMLANSDANGNQGGADNEFRILNNGAAYADGGWNGAADYAEYFETDDTSIDKTEVVCIDPQGHSKMKRCDSANSDNVLGVMSTKPGVVGAVGEDTTIAFDQKENKPNWKIVGLLGQIPTKVSTENGAIVAGDFLTSSSIPGVAMKSTKPGMTIGKALENYSGKEVGKINVLVQPTWHGNASSDDSQQQQLDNIKKEIEILKSKK